MAAQDQLLEKFLEPIQIDLETCHALTYGFFDCFKALAANPTDQFLPTPISDAILRPIADTGCGRNLAIDIGGTNLRVGFIELLGKQQGAVQKNDANGAHGVDAINGATLAKGTLHTPPSRIRRLFEKSWPIDNQLKNDNAEALFRWIGRHIAQVVGDAYDELDLSRTESLPMGVTFSFPSQQHSLAEATVTSMGKGFTMPPNTDLGVSLEKGYAESKPAYLPEIKVTAISNDSVSTLVSFIYNFGGSSNQRASMGLILGTGSNATVPLRLNLLHQSKWPRNINVLDGENLSNVKIAVNTEWSINGTAPPMRKLGLITPWDDQLSAQTEIPGFQPLEYMSAGRYLGELGRIMLVDYMVKTLCIAQDTLPCALLERHGLSTTFLSHFKPLEHGKLLASLRTELPESTAKDGFVWTEHLAEALYRIAKAIEVRAAGVIAAGTVALLTLSEELPANAAEAPPTAKELGVGYTGGCIVHFQDYLQDCQRFIDELMDKRFGSRGACRVVLSPCHDGGITGAGILVSAASVSTKTEAA
ncbi:hexokinase family protein XprF, putative [Cordyceps militaris CM01]|uniref:Phosphotransferase n=2 Tax=Cordyceps militaris TaxID=73501 RepID=G3JE81_CORMM|nr:hexokinase family protein XprF, putative [Cordyceps militaris CM01]ATY63794.1 hexokinase family [Cordyceps militaris]EGX92906.1 hexokinase family protein XprF, putative [Cordyceps militaris CM01]